MTLTAEAENILQRTKDYLIPEKFTPAQREEAENTLQEIIAEIGPAVEGYPTWHPLVANQRDRTIPTTIPCDRCGYQGLDHTCYFLHGFITCPYGDRVEEVLHSVRQLPQELTCAAIDAEPLGTMFYFEWTTAILVRCEWSDGLEPDLTIPKRWAVPLMMEQELPMWRTAEVGETWEAMQTYILGAPHLGRSSLFVTEDTGLALKKMYLAMIASGMYGPIFRG